MNVAELFLQRHNVLYGFYLSGIRENVPEDLMRQRPHPRLNSIAWILWHLTRVEDAGLNRFVVDRSQVLDDGQWMQRMKIPWRHSGNGMTFTEVDDLNKRIDLQALHDYSNDVRVRTIEIVTQIDPDSLDAVMEVDHLHTILYDEGLAMSTQAAGLLENYTGWTKGRCLMSFGLTHPFQHVGEIETIATLLGLEM